MTRREKKQIRKELTAIASLRDSDIDTSDIPEIADWSRAVAGRFYQSEKTNPARPASSSTITPHQRPDLSFGMQLSPGSTLAKMTHNQLLLECVEGHANAWAEFVQRWNKLISVVVMRAAIRWGETSREVNEDLIQDVYVTLVADDSRVLRRFEPRDENAFAGYLKVVTANVVNAYFRSAHSSKRVIDSTSNEVRLELEAFESSVSDTTAERAILLEEIDRLLKDQVSKSSVREQDRAIFWHYYRHGLTTEEIASLPEFNLTVKGVESVISRLTKGLKRDLAQELSADQS